MRGIIDRFEDNDIVVLELQDKSTVDLPRKEFPEGVKIGDVVYKENGFWKVDRKATKKREKKIKKLMDELWED